MGFFGKEIRNIGNATRNYNDFWDWFLTKEKDFYEIIKNHDHIESGFFDIISPRLKQINQGYYFLVGMYDDSTVELIITVDGEIKNIVFAEEIVEASPVLKRWKFTALKPEMNAAHGIQMDGLEFTGENILFYPNESEGYPDEIDITFVYEGLMPENKESVVKGICVFLDNFLGELNFATQIDTFNIISKEEAKKELIPVIKLKDFLAWREREFTEKYKNVKNIDDEEQFSVLEASLQNGLPLIATVNTSLLTYDAKASYPWISVIRMQYEGRSNNGLPENDDHERLNEIEEKIINKLKVEEGHLYIGHESADNLRECYFASKDFRDPSRVIPKVIAEHPEYEISLEIYKDKYWQSFERYTI
ncbi:DUF695 domain-containing protein [Chryseobacterium sp. CKR4-1]|jgi:hypothetical protein|uniref:DUF695 domain-containing protein n=1 Tax=Chryseobacterium sp. CKR4-1 TaxID=3068896 RepID=UPI002796B901|nr:DUF695 domain-containing protein [Chryseobacterium sp. CKR4-1]MDQ1806462.1 DUF695 domain-containing protein [Chryseobacterium sp. CKR4-1]